MDVASQRFMKCIFLIIKKGLKISPFFIQTLFFVLYSLCFKEMTLVISSPTQQVHIIKQLR